MYAKNKQKRNSQPKSLSWYLWIHWKSNECWWVRYAHTTRIHTACWLMLGRVFFLSVSSSLALYRMHCGKHINDGWWSSSVGKRFYWYSLTIYVYMYSRLAFWWLLKKSFLPGIFSLILHPSIHPSHTHLPFDCPFTDFFPFSAIWTKFLSGGEGGGWCRHFGPTKRVRLLCCWLVNRYFLITNH